jgi:hypothetical protein
MRDVLLAGWLGCAAVPLGAGSRLWHLPRQPLPTPMSAQVQTQVKIGWRSLESRPAPVVRRNARPHSNLSVPQPQPSCKCGGLHTPTPTAAVCMLPFLHVLVPSNDLLHCNAAVLLRQVLSQTHVVFRGATNPPLPRSSCPDNTDCDFEPLATTFPGSSLLLDWPGTCTEDGPVCRWLGKRCYIAHVQHPLFNLLGAATASTTCSS